MEKVQKTCSNVQPVGEPDQYGNLAFSVSFSDNSSGFFKCKEQDLFQVGVESTFYIDKAVGKSGKEYSKILRVSAVEFNQENNVKKSPGVPGSSTNKETSDMINRSVAIKAVCELRAQTNQEIKTIIKEADILFDYIQFGINDEPAKSPVTLTTEDTNELPF